MSSSSRVLRRYAPFFAILALQFVLIWMTPGSSTTTTVDSPAAEDSGQVGEGAVLDQQTGPAAGSTGAPATSGDSASAAAGGTSVGASNATRTGGGTTAT